MIDNLRRHGLRVIVSLAIAAPFVMHAGGIINWGVLRTLEYFAYDARLQLTLPGTVDPRIVIVDVDEQSLAAEGRWPWSRDRMARLVDLLFDEYEIAVLGFDMVFAESERHLEFEELAGVLRSRGEPELAEQVAGLHPRTDEQFAASLDGRPVALGYYFSNNTNTVGLLPEPYLPAEIAETLASPAPSASGYGANLAMLQSAARGGGFFDNPLSDEDGVFRRAPTFQFYEGDLYESLSLAVTQLYIDKPLGLGENNEQLFIGDRSIPVDGDMAVLVPYRGLQGSFPYISASEVLSRSVPDPAVLEGAIVLIGTTAPGLYDLRSTPVQKVYPGVEIHANLISGFLDGRFLHRPAFLAGAELITVCALAVVLAVALPLLGAVSGALLTVGVLSSVVGANIYLWVEQALYLSIAPIVVMVLGLFLFNVAYGFIAESRSRRALAHRFGRYVPPELVEEMSANPAQYSMKGERRDMSVLFSDVRGFSNLAEKMDPVQLSELMNELLTALTGVIHDQRGTIDKYMGDAVMAFWGAPLTDTRHASGAVSAALKMVEAVDGVKDDFVSRGWPTIRMGIGVNSGAMNVGDMGSEFRMAYTVMGDAVNLGSRLEGLTRTYGVDIIVSEYTAHAAPEFVYRPLDRVRVKGRDTPLDIYEPLGVADGVTEDIRREAEGMRQGLGFYRSREWARAEEIFRYMVEEFGDGELYRLYIDRINGFVSTPPPENWDGVFDFQAK